MKLRKYACIVFVSLFFQYTVYADTALQAVEAPKDTTQCSTAREYITSIEYFRAHSDFHVSENDARGYSMRIAQGCSGAAQRFIKVVSVLTQADVPAPDAIKTGLKFSKETDEETATFNYIFLTLYSPDHLDLNTKHALQLATQLFSEFNGDKKSLQRDFETMVGFCLGSKYISMPRPQCGPFAIRIVKKGDKWAAGISQSFIQLYDFVSSEAGPHLTPAQALTLVEELTEAGPNSSENFTQAYRYAVAKNGLQFSVQDAVQFAKKLTLLKKAE